MRDGVREAMGKMDAERGRAPAAVRFDAPGGGRSFRFDGARGVLRADALDEVLPVLAAVERAVADGLHAAGFVAYEAAPAFDPAFATHPPDPRLPLAWFTLYERREETRPDYDAAEADEEAEGSAGDEAELGPWRIDLDEAAYAERI
ncbi:MAG TPA: hypothetical protein VE871_04805, partial [Longimicrobium sp.]|nr:hypothetical protein [Longimicrobium sp.]